MTTWDTKTAAGTRTIHLSPSTAELLRVRKKADLTEWIFLHPWNPEQPTRPSTAYERMEVLVKEALLPDIGFHNLRHPFATHALTSQGWLSKLCPAFWNTQEPHSPSAPKNRTYTDYAIAAILGIAAPRPINLPTSDCSKQSTQEIGLIVPHMVG